MNQVVPTKLKVTKNYANASEIKCLTSGKLVNVDLPFEPILQENEYAINNGSIVVWSNGKFAKITKCTKCNNCKACELNRPNLKLKSLN